MMRFADLTYSDEELERDAIHYFKEQVYEPLYGSKVKEFAAEDIADFKQYYDDADYLFLNLFYDDYRDGYVFCDDKKVFNTDFRRLVGFMDSALARLDIDEDEVERYAFMLDAEFRKNAFCSHMEPYFSGYDAVVSTVVVGCSRNPLFTIYSMAREWCMALHLKKMHPEMVRRFGYRYQRILFDYKGEERLRRLIDFRDKYRHTFNHSSILRAIHSSVFAYAYLFLASVRTREVLIAEKFIMDNSSSKVTLLLQGESIRNFDFTVTKYVIDKLKEGHYKELMHEDGRIDWDALYMFTFEAIKEAGFEGIHFFGFDSIEAKTMQSFWNKSANMQSMLKILRRLALESNNPVFNRLIEGCEYRMGRPDKVKNKMEYFIEETRKIMAARAYELTKPRTMAQELVSAFPSVFLVYFQWHHNFRNVYPRVPKVILQENERQMQKQKQNVSLKDKLKEQSEKRLKNNEAEYQEKLQAIMRNKEKMMAELSGEKAREQQNSILISIEKNQRQNA